MNLSTNKQTLLTLGWIKVLILPALTQNVHSAVVMGKVMRYSWINMLGLDYVHTLQVVEWPCVVRRLPFAFASASLLDRTVVAAITVPVNDAGGGKKFE